MDGWFTVLDERENKCRKITSEEEEAKKKHTQPVTKRLATCSRVWDSFQAASRLVAVQLHSS